MCPTCGGRVQIFVSPSYGRCPETGYDDAGERYRCTDCGDESDLGELVSTSTPVYPNNSSETVRLLERAGCSVTEIAAYIHVYEQQEVA